MLTAKLNKNFTENKTKNAFCFNLTRLRIVDNAQRYERWDGGPIPPGGSK